MLLRSFLLCLSELETARHLLTRSGIGQRMARRFIAGGDLEDAVGGVHGLNDEGVEATLDSLGPRGARVSPVQCGHQDPPELAFPHKADVDRNFVKLMERLLASGGYRAIATHAPRLLAGTKAYAQAHGLSADRFEFQMLYGIRRH